MEDFGAVVSGGLRVKTGLLTEEFKSHNLIVLSNDPEAIHFCALLNAHQTDLYLLIRDQPTNLLNNEHNRYETLL
jgi:hypothetical protein